MPFSLAAREDRGRGLRGGRELLRRQARRAGHEVHFLLRSDYEAVRRNGVSILSPQGDFHVHPRCARMPDEIGLANLVLIG